MLIKTLPADLARINLVKIVAALRAGPMRDYGSIFAALRSGHAMAQLFAVLRYKPECHGFDSLEFFFYYGFGVVSASNRNEYLGRLLRG